jgi:hypothetical protein
VQCRDKAAAAGASQLLHRIVTEEVEGGDGVGVSDEAGVQRIQAAINAVCASFMAQPDAQRAADDVGQVRLGSQRKVHLVHS